MAEPTIEEVIELARVKWPEATTVWLMRCESYGWGEKSTPIEIGWRVRGTWTPADRSWELGCKEDFAPTLARLAAKLKSKD